MALAQRMLYQVVRPAGTSGGLLQHAAALTSLLRYDVTRLSSTAAQAQRHSEQGPASSTGQAGAAADATSNFTAPSPSGTGFAASGAQQEQQAGGSTSSDSSSSSSGEGGSSTSDSNSTGAGSTTAHENSNEGASTSSSGGSAGEKLFSSFQDGFSSFRARMGGSTTSSSSSQAPQGPPVHLLTRAQRLAAAVAREVKDAVLPRNDAISLTRAYEGPRYAPGADVYEGTTAVATVQQPQSRYSKLMEDLYSKFGHHPLFKRMWSVDVRANPVVRRAGEVAEDIRDRYETLDHPVVHKVEDVKERLFGMSDAAAAMAQILARDPGFDMARLLASVKADAPVIVKAFLTHDLATLRQHCGPELMEKFAGIFKHFEAEGLHEDPTILFVSEVELVEMRSVEDEPLVVAQFNCQQIKCTRDPFGNVMDGSPNSIQKVFYFWGLQQEATGTVLPDGRVLPPRWVIKDMMWQSRLALV